MTELRIRHENAALKREIDELRTLLADSQQRVNDLGYTLMNLEETIRTNGLVKLPGPCLRLAFSHTGEAEEIKPDIPLPELP